MPKYYQDKIYGYYLYFTSFCTVECMHVHADGVNVLSVEINEICP